MPERTRLFVCTREPRLIRVAREGALWKADPLLDDHAAQCVATDGSRVLVGTRDRGVLLSVDGGDSWTPVQLGEQQVHSVAISPADGALYAGTEPSRLFVSRDGERWSELEALQDIPSRARWSFPPRPWTHHVRWIAPDPYDADRLVVAIELGGVMYSDDGGASFSDHRPGAKLDAHTLVWHAHERGRVYEAAGDGAAWSHDSGRSWKAADAGRDLRYCWALAVDPVDPDCWYVSASAGPRDAHAGNAARGRLYRWSGSEWDALTLPTECLPYALAIIDSVLVAVTADGRFFLSADRGESWNDTGFDTGPVLAMAAG